MRLSFRRKQAEGINSNEFAVKRMREDKSEDSDVANGKLRLRTNPLKGYKSWSYAAITRIVGTGAACPWTTFTGEKKNSGTNPLQELIASGNPLQNSVRLFSTTMLNLELWGLAYWKIERKGDKPVELWPIPSALMAPGQMENGLPATWKYTGTEGKQVEIAARDIIWFRYPSPGGALDSMSPMSAAEAAIQCDLYALRYYSLFFERGADPHFAITYPADVKVDEDQRRQLREQWAQAYASLKRFFKPVILSGGAKLEKLTGEPQQAWIRLREQWREEILAIWGVPPAIVGVYQYANYANVREQRKIFWQQTIQPKHAAIAADINEQLAPQVQGGGEFKWDYSGIPELRPDLTEEVQLAMPTMTVNEIRERYFGLESVAWGEIPAASVGLSTASPQ